jgi:hypothetical protein
MTARWSFGPVCGAPFGGDRLSPEILIFLFFMITDPKTTPAGRVARIRVAVARWSLLIAPQAAEFGARSRCWRASSSCASPAVLREVAAAGSNATGGAYLVVGAGGAGYLTPGRALFAGRSPVARSFSWGPR